MSKHTPGEWSAHGVLIHGPDGMIGEVGFGLRDDPEMLANARLIAAAPSLLAACKALLKQHEREGRHRGGAFPLTAIEAAVAKAEGTER